MTFPMYYYTVQRREKKRKEKKRKETLFKVI
jgi:hypothetical protein